MPKYNDINTIPARTFFEILKSNNLQLLKPKPSEIGLEDVFISIYDEYFLKSDNNQAKNYFELIKNVAFLKYKIDIIRQTLHFVYYNRMTKEMYFDIINALKEGCNIEIDTNLPFKDEVKRVLEVELGILQNDLSIDEMQINDIVKDATKKAFDYEEKIVSMEQNLKRDIKENISLAKYIALEKLEQKLNSK